MSPFRLAALILGVSVAAAVQAQEYSRHYEAVRLDNPIVVDGALDDAAWEKVPWTDTYILYGTLTGVPVTPTRAKIAWDAENLYLGVEATDQDIWSSYTAHDSNLWEEDVVEMFIDPEGDAQGYLEFEISPRNVVLDLWVEKPLFSQGGPSHFEWNALGLRTAVRLDGTLGGKTRTAPERQDTDTGWSMELALPWADVAIVSGVMSLPPRQGDTWRINVMRYDYRRTSREELSQWSPSAASGAWHEPKEYGYVTFVAPSTAVESSSWGQVKALWRAAGGIVE
ncbi:MAG: carbohydrate-binding family 9-like protein [Candidatus Latescibacterota bacterium]|jgi:hypothetical protein